MTPPDKIAGASLADDLLEGADAIAAFIYGNPKQRRKMHHLASTNRIPTFNLGATICARKSILLDWIRAQEKLGTSPGEGAPTHN